MDNHLRAMHPLLYHKFGSNAIERDYVGMPGEEIKLEGSTFSLLTADIIGLR